MPGSTPHNEPPFQRLDQSAGFPYGPGEYIWRYAWLAVQAVMVWPSPARAYGWRRFWLRAFGATVASTSRTRPSTRVMHPWLLTLGEHASLGDGVIVYNLGPVLVGDHSLVSQRTHLCAGTHDYTKPDLPLLRPPITIGSGVWVCAEAFIGPGVTVGDNSVVGARAVVTQDVPPGVVVAGNPAKVVKQRVMNVAECK